MVKVFLTSAMGRESDLFPEHMALREVLDSFGVNDENSVYMVDGEVIREEDMEKPLHMFGKDSVVKITSLLKPGQDPEISPDDTLKEIPEERTADVRVSFPDSEQAGSQEFSQISLEKDKYREAFRALSELRDTLDAVLKELKQAELPF